MGSFCRPSAPSSPRLITLFLPAHRRYLLKRSRYPVMDGLRTQGCREFKSSDTCATLVTSFQSFAAAPSSVLGFPVPGMVTGGFPLKFEREGILPLRLPNIFLCFFIFFSGREGLGSPCDTVRVTKSSLFLFSSFPPPLGHVLISLNSFLDPTHKIIPCKSGAGAPFNLR